MPVLSPEQQLFAETVRKVAEERIAPIGARMEEDVGVSPPGVLVRCDN